MANVLIVDDDAVLREALCEAVAALGHRVSQASTGAVALAAIEGGDVQAVLLDLRMPGMDGIEVLRRVRTRSAPPPVTVLTAHATAANTIEAMRLGAFDHLTKPIGRADIERVVAAMVASHDVVADRDPPPGEADELIGSSAAMRAVQKTIGRLADTGATVLVTGETGTGKELVARAIHEHGRRGKAPFVAVNCAAIPRDLLESELFGHVRGAFTGATSDRPGAFRDAHGGTLFLDEIGDMDLAMQAKILHVLQERVVTPVGGRSVAIDVRIVAATHQVLENRVRVGGFREDLFYRLNVVPIHLPPLRERIADIVPLAEHFLRQAGGASLSADAAALVIRHDWPGNVRELRNAMQRVAVLVQAPQVKARDLDFLDGAKSRNPAELDWPEEDMPTAVAHLEELLIRRALHKSGGNRTEAARLLNIRRQFLYAKLERYGIALSDERTEDVRAKDAILRTNF
jgi:two-component system NtrC family response regulator